MFLITTTADEIDGGVAGTFRTGAPPVWAPAMARRAPHGSADATNVDDVSRTHAERTLAQALVSLLAVAGLALLVPLAILAVAVPVALGVRGLLEIVVGLWSAVS